MKETEFNLLEETWVRVLCPDGSVREVSLLDALLHAEDYVDLAGELPTQDMAVLRLLLAVLHTVFGRVDADGQDAPITTPGEAFRRWKSLWQRGHFPEAPIRDYLTRWRDRFWLFDPERPFWQVPGAQIGTAYTSAKLNGEVAESGNKLRLFSAYAGSGKTELTYAQAARWLLYVNGYDDTSAKPKGKDLPSPGAGWLGKLGLIQAVGNNLFETLLLNLTLLQDGVSLWEPNRPCWELDTPKNAERTEIPQPNNPAQLLTLQSRRLLLQRDHGKVIGYVLLGGDFFERENAFCEQMTVWRTIPGKRGAPTVYTPKRHDPNRLFWREFPAVFLEEPNARFPGVVRWIAGLQAPRNACLPRGGVVRFRIAAVKYGDKDFFVADAFSDELSFHASLLEDLGKWWRVRIKEEIGRCERLADAVGNLAEDLARAAGHDDKTQPKEAAKEQFFFRIDQPFRQWLAQLDPDWDEEEREQNLQAWRSTAKRITLTWGAELAEKAGPAAFAGRNVTIKNGKTETKVLYATPKAYNRFLYIVKTIDSEPGGAK